MLLDRQLPPAAAPRKRQTKHQLDIAWPSNSGDHRSSRSTSSHWAALDDVVPEAEPVDPGVDQHSHPFEAELYGQEAVFSKRPQNFVHCANLCRSPKLKREPKAFDVILGLGAHHQSDIIHMNC